MATHTRRVKKRARRLGVRHASSHSYTRTNHTPNAHSTTVVAGHSGAPRRLTQTISTSGFSGYVFGIGVPVQIIAPRELWMQDIISTRTLVTRPASQSGTLIGCLKLARWELPSKPRRPLACRYIGLQLVQWGKHHTKRRRLSLQSLPNCLLISIMPMVVGLSLL